MEFPRSGRLAAFDFGTARIGVAVCDPDWILASPLAVMAGGNYRDREAEYIKLFRDERISGVVVGLPIHADGKESPSSQKARAFAEWLLQFAGLPLRMFDERFTTVDASQRLQCGGMSRKKKQQRIDAVAATVLLESFMEACRYRGEIVGSEVTGNAAEPLDG